MEISNAMPVSSTVKGNGFSANGSANAEQGQESLDRNLSEIEKNRHAKLRAIQWAEDDTQTMSDDLWSGSDDGYGYDGGMGHTMKTSVAFPKRVRLTANGKMPSHTAS